MNFPQLNKRVHIGSDDFTISNTSLNSYRDYTKNVGKYLIWTEATEIEDDEIRDLAIFVNFLFALAVTYERNITSHMVGLLRDASADASDLKSQVDKFLVSRRPAPFNKKLKNIGMRLHQAAQMM